jgi:hypothetical protein
VKKLIALVLVAACQRGSFLSSGASGHISITGSVSGTDGSAIASQPLVHLTTNSTELASASATATGTYNLEADVPSGTTSVVVAVDLTGTNTATKQYAPQLTTVRIAPGIATYKADLQMVPVTMTALSTTSMTDIPVVVLGQTAHVLVPPSASQGAYAITAPIEPVNAPGTMKPAGQTDQALQSTGMFYIDAFDTTGRIAITGTMVELGGVVPADIPDADAFNSWSLGSGGDWNVGAPLPQSSLDAAPGMFSADQFGYWNSDRAFKTACLTGTVTSASAACPGAAVSASGPDNIVSHGTTDSSGGFCVEGAQTRQSTLSIAGMTRSVTMPSSAGSCAAPASCTNIGTITVTDTSKCGDLDTSGGECDTSDPDRQCDASDGCFQSCATSVCGFYLTSNGTVFGPCLISDPNYQACLMQAAMQTIAYCEM